MDAWRTSNPRIVQFWWDVDREVKRCIKERCATETHGLRFTYESGFLFPPWANTSCRHCSPANQAMTRASIAEKSDTMNFLAIGMDARSKEKLTIQMRQLTDLENPNSVQQMKQWLADHGLEMDSLGKKEVAALLKTAPAPRMAISVSTSRRL